MLINFSFGHFLGQWASFSFNHARRILLLFLCLIPLLLWYAFQYLEIQTDTNNILSDKLVWRENLNAYKKQFPQDFSEYIIVIHSDIPEKTAQFQKDLYIALETMPGIENIYFGKHEPFFEQNALLYESTPKLKEFVNGFPVLMPFIQSLLANPTVENFFDTLNNDFKSQQTNSQFYEKLFSELTRALRKSNEKNIYPLSWSKIFNPTNTQQSNQSIRTLVVKSQTQKHKKQLNARFFEQLKKILDEQLMKNRHVDAKITGELALRFEELNSVNEGTLLAMGLSLLMVTLLLYYSLQSSYLVAYAVITLMAGLVTTTALATFFIGHLNLISMAFGVLYIGLGIDFSIHLCLRFKELILEKQTPEIALRSTFYMIGPSLVFCALTTAAGFLSFLPTNFKGIAELGLIAGMGMCICLVFNFTLLPALIKYLPPMSTGFSRCDDLAVYSTRWYHFPKRYRGSIALFSIFMALISIHYLPLIRFEADPMLLRNPKQPSVLGFKSMQEANPKAQSALIAMTKDKMEINAWKKALQKEHNVGRTLSFSDFIPKEQNIKLKLIANLKNTFDILKTTEKRVLNSVETTGRTQEAILNFGSTLQQWLVFFVNKKSTLEPIALSLNDELNYFLDHMNELNAQAKEKKLTEFKKILFMTLTPALKTLENLTNAKRITIENMPEEIQRDWISPEGYEKLVIQSAYKFASSKQKRKFLETIEKIIPSATGLPLVYQKAEETVIHSFFEAFTYAGLIIAFLLLLLFRDILNVIFVFIPLIFACLFTLLFSIIFSIPFNFANIIALPLLLGVGVDSGIHLVHRYNQETKESPLLQTSTSKAIMASILSTLISFGNLIFSSHLGIKSMGELLSIGMLAMLVCTLIILPALLTFPRRN